MIIHVVLCIHADSCAALEIYISGLFFAVYEYVSMA